MGKYDSKRLEKLDNPRRRQMMPPVETLNKFDILDAATFLDIGCGIGYFTLAAGEILKNGKVIGIDTDSEILDIAKEKSQGIENIEYRKSDEYSFPLEDKSIDYAFACNIIHEVEDKTKFLIEIKRVVKSDGYLCIIEWDKKPMEMGPRFDERISIDEIKRNASLVDMVFVEDINLGNLHYGLKLKIV